MGLLSRFAARGVDVPGQISIIGYDDIVISAMVNPQLTTISHPKEMTGRAGVDLLVQLMASTARSRTGDVRSAGPIALPARRELPAHLLVRQSTGPAAATRGLPSPRGQRAARGA